jgi:hypothetical protein
MELAIAGRIRHEQHGEERAGLDTFVSRVCIKLMTCWIGETERLLTRSSYMHRAGGYGFPRSNRRDRSLNLLGDARWLDGDQ